MTIHPIKILRLLAVTWVLSGLVLATGCALYRNDRCYVDQGQYSLVRDLYVQSGSLDLVERELIDMQWERCKINESLYRLRKEFAVLPEVLPVDGVGQ